MLLGVNKVEDSYKSIFKKVDYVNLEFIRESLCLPGTTWLKSLKPVEKTVLRMDRRPHLKMWYKLLKNSLMPTPHNAMLNKERLVLIHCITVCTPVNITKIICQEIHVCAKKNDGMSYFL